MALSILSLAIQKLLGRQRSRHGYEGVSNGGKKQTKIPLTLVKSRKSKKSEVDRVDLSHYNAAMWLRSSSFLKV